MQLRLKKWNGIGGTYWRIFQDGKETGVISRDGDLMLEDIHGTCFYTWNEKNTYKTEYRKMRQALIHHLNIINYFPKVEPKDEKWVEPEAMMEELDQKIASLEETLVSTVNKLADAQMMIIDLGHEKHALNTEIEKLRKNLEMKDCQIAFLGLELEKLQWEPSNGSVHQAAMCQAVLKTAREFKKKGKPKYLEIPQ